MWHGRRRSQWHQTASVMALIANCHRDPKRKSSPYHPRDFLPADLRKEVQASHGMRLTRETLHALKPVFSKKSGDGK